MKYHLLLLEDVINHGRKGELVYAAPGYARNYLLPNGKALLASMATIRMREKLQKEREEQAAVDRKKSQELADKLKGKMLETVVKVDPDGHMYGSVTAAEVATILEGNGFAVDKKSVALHHPIRTIGNYEIQLKLPEDVEASFGLEVKPDRVIEKKKKAAKKAEVEAEANAEGAEEAAPEAAEATEEQAES